MSQRSLALDDGSHDELRSAAGGAGGSPHARLLWLPSEPDGLAEDGAVYEGAFENDVENGYGTKEWADGIKYVGEWKDGMMHGQGRYTTAEYDGANVMEGEFEEDCFVG